MNWRDVLDAECPGERREVASMCCGIRVFRQCRSLLLIPDRELRVLPTGHYNKDFVQAPQAITNNSSVGNRVEMSIMGKPLSENDSFIAGSLEAMGLDPGRTVAFGTAAHMDNAAIANGVSADGIPVSVASTGGVRGNGGRAGDPASFDEAERGYAQKSGTIVIIVAVDVHMTDGAMLEAMSVATQAKSCVLQELAARSLYSHGVATGSGTDQVGIACSVTSDRTVERAGAGTDLGVEIARCVRRALFRTLGRQSGMVHGTQCDPYVMLSRFGIRDSDIHNEVRYPSTMASLLEADADIRRDRALATAVSAVLSVADGVEGGRLDPDAGMRAARRMTEGTILAGVDVDPVSRKVMDDIASIPEYVGFAVSLVLRQRAGRAEVSTC